MQNLWSSLRSTATPKAKASNSGDHREVQSPAQFSWANICTMSGPFVLALLTNVTTQELYPHRELHKQWRSCFQTNTKIIAELTTANSLRQHAATESHQTLFLLATATSPNLQCSKRGGDAWFSPITRGTADAPYASSRAACEQMP